MNKYLRFAPILLIPFLIGCENNTNNNGKIYYDHHQLSLNNNEQNIVSDADNLLNYIEAKQVDKTTSSSQYGEKFFLTIVRKGCKGCMDVMPGFEYLETNWGKENYKDTSNKDAKYLNYVIYANEESDVPNIDLFDKFYNDHVNFFKKTAEYITTRPYYRLMGGMQSNYGQSLNRIIQGEHYPTPTTYMIDFNYKDAGVFGVVDMLFNFNNAEATLTNKELADTLIDCWNHDAHFTNAIPA